MGVIDKLKKIVTSSSGRVSQLLLGSGNNQFVRASDYNKLVDTTNTIIDELSNSTGAPVYDANLIPFGDGVTVGGETNQFFTFTKFNEVGTGNNGGDFFVTGFLNGIGTSEILTNTNDGYIFLRSASNEDFGFTLNSATAVASLQDQEGNGIYFASQLSSGLGAVNGLGIDLLNGTYNLGNGNNGYLLQVQNNQIYTGQYEGDAIGLYLNFNPDNSFFTFGDPAAVIFTHGTSLQITDNKFSFVNGTINMPLPSYSNDAAAGTAGLVQGDLYQQLNGAVFVKQ